MTAIHTFQAEEIQEFMAIYAEMDLILVCLACFSSHGYQGDFVTLNEKVEDLCTKFQQDKQQASLNNLYAVRTKVGPLYLLMQASRQTIGFLNKQIAFFAKKCARIEDVAKLHNDYEKALEEVPI